MAALLDSGGGPQHASLLSSTHAGHTLPPSLSLSLSLSLNLKQSSELVMR
jgi:hypothetical protein